MDGEAGVAYPRETKLNKYFLLALSVAQLPAASQKQWQVACGGLVYFSMFRRPLLGSLNQVWRHIQVMKTAGEGFCQLLLTVNWNSFASWDSFPWLGWTLDLTCTHKLAAVMLPPPGEGGICASARTFPIRAMVPQGDLRGQWAEPGPEVGVLAIGLFDGI